MNDLTTRETTMLRFAAVLPAVLAPALAAAHEGHGLANPHWHASDLFGLLLVVAVAAGVLWWRGRK
ncbi:MAG: hypothetical protein KIT35_23710 [Piscinibacter sp.]|uniref:hypothetical protein n=1 Tax=Piscinibacter sp. TaxID=1903157 RepID=UPI0025844550|nr:hypothetical protein [Piscinibacter sp.]MCW5666852.1 hypothetical protein [Piscinibacter sp.]